MDPVSKGKFLFMGTCSVFEDLVASAFLRGVKLGYIIAITIFSKFFWI